MLRRETFVMKLIAFGESQAFKIQLQRSASGETLVFSSVEELVRYIEHWKRQTATPPDTEPVKK